MTNIPEKQIRSRVPYVLNLVGLKDKARSFAATPATVKEDVKALAQADVADGTISTEEYADLIGEAYPVAEPTDTDEV